MPAITKKGKHIVKWRAEHPEEYALAMKKAGLTLSIRNETETFVNPFKGKKHTEETKAIVREKAKVRQLGSGNNMYGTCWVTKERENKRIQKADLQEWLDNGWVKGRVFDEEFAKKSSSNTSGKVYITNGKRDKLVKPEDVDGWLEQGWVRGSSKVGRIAISNGKQVKLINQQDFPQWKEKGYFRGTLIF